jgi:transcriptional regulator with GAF, ATPase, and Fis domain
MEKDYLLKALELSNGSKQKAARLLGLSLPTIKYRLKRLGL